MEHVRALHSYLISNGITGMLFGDMLAREHNGGPPHNLADRLSELPTDLVITDWSPKRDPMAAAEFRRHGFAIHRTNSPSLSAAQSAIADGNIFDAWAKPLWLTERQGDRPRANLIYSYLSTVMAAEWSWNHYPDNISPEAPLEGEFFRRRLRALTRLPGVTPPSVMSTLPLGEGPSTHSSSEPLPYPASYSPPPRSRRRFP